MTDELNAEDAKLVTLARSSRARNQAAEGAAVRDDTGRTYAATTVSLPSLRLAALDLAVAMAVSSGADALEAAAVVTAEPAVAASGLAPVRDLGGGGVPVFVASPDGLVDQVAHTEHEPTR